MTQPPKIWRMAAPSDGSGRLTACVSKWEIITCPLSPGHKRCGRRLSPYTLKWEDKFEERDVMWDGWCLAGPRFREVVADCNLTGLSYEEVEFEGGPPGLKKDWPMLKTLGWGGIAGTDAGVGILPERSCKGCGHVVYSSWNDATKLFDPARWDRSDFFMIWPLPMFIFVTDHAREAIARARLKGMRFVNINDLKPSDGTLMPGRLGMYFPEELARERAGREDIV